MKRSPLKRKTRLTAKTPLRRVSKKVKKKRDTVSSLRRKLDTVFSEYIRRSHADPNGYVRCCTCGKAMRWQDSQAGHYRKRGFAATRHEEENVHPQCPRCNHFLDGNESSYAVYLVKRYGPDIIVDLYEQSNQEHKWRVTELRKQVAEYKAKLEALR